jgi:hypothetical protein
VEPLDILPEDLDDLDSKALLDRLRGCCPLDEEIFLLRSGGFREPVLEPELLGDVGNSSAKYNTPVGSSWTFTGTGTFTPTPSSLFFTDRQDSV